MWARICCAGPTNVWNTSDAPGTAPEKHPLPEFRGSAGESNARSGAEKAAALGRGGLSLDLYPRAGPECGLRRPAGSRFAVRRIVRNYHRYADELFAFRQNQAALLSIENLGFDFEIFA